MLATLPLADAGKRAEQMRYLAGKKPQGKQEFERQIAGVKLTQKREDAKAQVAKGRE